MQSLFKLSQASEEIQSVAMFRRPIPTVDGKSKPTILIPISPYRLSFLY